MIYGYKTAEVGIAYLGCSESVEQLVKALTTAGVNIDGMETTEVEPVMIDGKYYLDGDSDAQEAERESSKQKKLLQLDSDYQSQKQELINQYTDDMLHGDTDAMDADKQAMVDLDTWYDEEYKKIEGGEE